jgi:hypothetical protein
VPKKRRVPKKEILVAFTVGDSGALGNIWRLTAKRTDFYLDPLGQRDAVHLSVHGPNERLPDGHRFHVKVNRKAAANLRAEGHFIVDSIPRKGHVLNGRELAPGAFLLARIRWLWHLQRPRFRQAALSGPAPTISDNRAGARPSGELQPNEAADLDLVVSYDMPYWPHETGSLRNNARLGPLRNDVGLWLTTTSYRRSQMEYPTPEGLVLPLPAIGEEPNRIMGGGPGVEQAGDIYWFVETITSRQLIESSMSTR